ncbi:Ig-like domain-containing protein [Massilia sp. IC2-278]|uniref:Ig-like domain-containing protein n=1 Tax=Massilia sp. IC2-278 TaxID=2887200 RepID=UPI001E315FD2|nr:Ig-like domain-containing protein [Massilia sp. IC2-278]MCC2961349.1 Ig-like domain-containing protein [Massilia sp. IC2-278]
MQHSFKSSSSASPLRLAALTLIAAAALSACGGGGGNPGSVAAPGGASGGTSPTTPTTPAVPAAPTVTLALANTGGQASNSLSGATPLTVQATVKDASGNPVKEAMVTFATDASLAIFSPSAGTALTDDQGVARISLRSASLAAGGAGKLTATASVGGATIVGERNFQVGATTLSFGTVATRDAQIQAYDSTEITVPVLAGGTPYLNQVNVNFTSACVTAGKATLAPTVATNNGVAKTVYRDKGCANDDVITVTADGVSVPATVPLKIAPPTAASVQFVSADPVEKSIVIRGQGGINRTETAVLKFRVFDTFGNPLPRRAVTFRVSDPAVVQLNKATDTTDENGEVITTVNSGPVATSFRVFATLPDTATASRPEGISTSSDSIVVTTGLPIQRAFSLSAENYNLEGLNKDSSPTTPATRVQVMIADASGNPVPDGTPVVFQTNMGSIGSSDKGGCSTVNGGCSVDFRTQDPRSHGKNQPATPCNTGSGPLVSDDSARAGLATVCASSSDGTNTIFSKIGLFFGGSSAAKVFLDNGTTALGTDVTDLGTVRAADSKVFVLQLNDVNLNPLPFGTQVQVANAVNAAAAAVVPATVPNIFPHSASADDITGVNVSGAQGSRHTFSISNPNAASCTAPVTATFNVTVTTPGNVVTTIPFKLTFSCP